MKNSHYLVGAILLAGLILPECKVKEYPDFPPIAFIGKGEGISDLYVIWDMNQENFEGPINLSNSLGHESSLSWANSNSWLAYASDHNEQYDIFIIDVAEAIAGTGRPINLTNGEGINFEPSWSPDNSKIAFASVRGIDAGVFIMNVDGSSPKFLAPGHSIENIQWSKDGSRIAYESFKDLYVVNSDSSGLECVNENFALAENLDLPVVIDFSMSPDGEFIAISLENFVDDSLRYDIVVVGNDGIEVMLWLKGENEKYLYPEISPSGQKIAFTQTPGMVCIVGFGEYKDDFPMRCYVSDLGVPLKPKWSSDGNYIAYLIYHPDHVGLNMQVMSSDGLYHTTVVDNWMVDIDYGDIEWAP